MFYRRVSNKLDKNFLVGFNRNSRNIFEVKYFS